MNAHVPAPGARPRHAPRATDALHLTGRARKTLRKALIRAYATAVLTSPPSADRSHVPLCERRYGDATGSPVPLALLGDSLSLSVGAGSGNKAVGAILAERLAAEAGVPVELTTVARFGATAGGLATQVSRLVGRSYPGVAVMCVGGNDVMVPGRMRTSARRLRYAVLALREAGWSVIVLTCPEIRAQPALRSWVRPIAGWRSRRLATLQTKAALRAGAHTVSLFDRQVLRGKRGEGMVSSDSFHPSAKCYSYFLERVAPLALAAYAERTGHLEARGGREVTLRDAARASVLVPGLQCTPGRPGYAFTRALHQEGADLAAESVEQSTPGRRAG
ncbi:GDSL-type esterase/lipase family protein [Streptomyces monticola]|uniref:GDSL-type esterase/lipase family protein n=1 Tax=Streptomyces monticola TaxID=2666263 RepID=A0ABW2JPF9_9ACTN